MIYFYKNQQIKVIDCFDIQFPHLSQISNYPFNDQILKDIENGKAIAATDALVKGKIIGGVWLLTNRKQEYKIIHCLYSKSW